MQKFLFDKEIVNNQLSVLNNTLASQRQSKKTLLSYLEKFSDAMYENFNSDNTDSLLSLINEAHSIFENIKLNINKTLELKNFLENISNSDFLNTIDSEKFNNDFNNLLENISKTNSDYLTFMNNYENFIKPPSNNENNSTTLVSENNIKESSIINEEIILEESVAENSTIEETIVEEHVNENPTIEETIVEEHVNENPIIEETAVEEHVNENPTIEETTIDLPESNEESLFETLAEKNVKNINENSVETESKIIDEKIENNSQKKDFTIIDEPINTEPTDESIPAIDLQERELIINKKSGIAILPYSISDLDELFLDDPEKYSSIQDIIDKEYTVKLKDFENSSIVRYKEAFKLAKDKSNYTFSQAANFAKRFLVETEITSLIIASCKNIEELEFYIECLNNNKLENFHHFRIIEK